MIYPQIYLTFDPPITLNLGPAANLAKRSVSRLPFTIQIDAVRREIRATLSPIQRPLLIYGPEDFSAACADPMEDHRDRVLQLLGSAPAATLQTLINGSELPPPPPRVPREIANWRAKAILAGMGKLETVESALAALPEPQRTVVGLAWRGDAKLARRSQTVLGMAQQLGMTAEEVDALFIAADALQV